MTNTSEDKAQLISAEVYRQTTETAEQAQNGSSHSIVRIHSLPEFYGRKSFESRGLINVIASTIIVTTLLCSFLFINLWYTTALFIEDDTLPTDQPVAQALRESSWKTSYDLPEGVSVFELHTSIFDSPETLVVCPEGKFALILYLESNLTSFTPWMKKCGGQVSHFRVNGEPQVAEVKEITQYVPNASYIPIKAEIWVAENDSLFSDPYFQKMIELDQYVITSMQISGYMTPEIVEDVVKMVPFVEDLTLEGTEICGSLVRPTVNSRKAPSEVQWDELSALRIIGTRRCNRMLDFIDTTWSLQSLESLQVTGNILDGVTVSYIELLVDKHRITKVKFEDNICPQDVQQSHEYICGSNEDILY